MKKTEDLYTSRYMDIHGSLFVNNKEVLLSVHAIKQARKRGIYPTMVQATINRGKIKRFGKNYLRFIRAYKKGNVACIGEDVGSHIIIKTIEWCK